MKVPITNWVRGKRNKLLSESLTKAQKRLPEEVIPELRGCISNIEIISPSVVLIGRPRPKETFLGRGLAKAPLELYREVAPHTLGNISRP